MANTYATLNDLFTGIADAIRAKKNSTATIVADTFPTEIRSLKTGFNYENHKVTSIADYEFKNCEDLLSVNAYSLQSIGTGAFEGCNRLKSVILWDNITSIGENAFKDCNEDLVIYCMFDSKPDGWDENWNPNGYTVNWLGGAIETWDVSATEDDNVTVRLYDSLQDEGKYTLAINGNGNMKNYYFSDIVLWSSYSSNIRNVIISNSVTSIGNYTFRNCTSLTSITIGNGVTSIGYNAFYGCTSLTSITIPDSVTSIGESVFYNTPWLKAKQQENPLVIVNGILIDGTTCSGDVIIPNSVTIININAFYGCTSLTSITIPDSVTSIGSYAFYGCKALTSINIPDSVTSIGSSAFYGCKALTSINIPDSVTSIGSSAFDGCTSLTSVIIGNGVTSIGESVFSGCKALTSINIPDSVTTIGSSAFYGCKLLASITIPDSVTSIGNYAFRNCTSLASITIGNGVSSIMSNMFENCDNLISITIGNSINISLGTFINLPSLKNINVYDNNSVYKSINGILYNKNGDTLITYPRGRTDINHNILDGITNIDTNAFRNCIYLNSITIPDSVTSIGGYSLYGCANLTSINYTGTISQWNATMFGSSWNANTGNYTIYCTDGTISKNGTITYYNTQEGGVS